MSRGELALQLVLVRCANFTTRRRGADTLSAEQTMQLDLAHELGDRFATDATTPVPQPLMIFWRATAVAALRGQLGSA